MTGFDFAAMQAQGNNAGVAELYILTMTPLPAAPAAESTPDAPGPLEIHYAYMHRLVELGKLLLAGPCMNEPTIPGQAPVPPGFGILHVASRAEAEEIARNEPFHAMGWRHNSVTAWTPKFGSLIEVLRSELTTRRNGSTDVG
jgi:uncharacterized protein YciI